MLKRWRKKYKNKNGEIDFLKKFYCLLAYCLAFPLISRSYQWMFFFRLCHQSTWKLLVIMLRSRFSLAQKVSICLQENLIYCCRSEKNYNKMKTFNGEYHKKRVDIFLNCVILPFFQLLIVFLLLFTSHFYLNYFLTN